MKSIYRLMLAPFFLLLGVLVSNAAIFSVYLVPNARKNSNEGFKRIEDIHYAYGDVAVPLHLKYGRQSMAYPVQQGKGVHFFTMDGEERASLCSVSVPEGAKKGIVLLSYTADGKCRASAHWFKGVNTKKTVHFYNLSGVGVGLKSSLSKRGMIVPAQKRIPFNVPFKSGQDHFTMPLQGYAPVSKKSSKKGRLVISRSLTFNKDDAHLVLLLRKTQKRFQSIVLYGNGIDNFHTLKEVQKVLPFYRSKETRSKESDGADEV